ncbi:hypothetical protein [Burkholderia phage vB_BpP_HN02]|uniref:Uncharacterized protein n=1 Tax=Burkholderia phage vB_BpP_HN02 TaxID=3116925 RepID=A0AAX4JH06_9CAUD
MASTPIVFRNREVEAELMLIPHLCLESFTKGLGNEQAFDTLTYRMLMAAALTKHIEVEEDFDYAAGLVGAAVQAMKNIGERLLKAGVWGVTGDEVRAIKDGLGIADQLQELVPMKQQSLASQKVGIYVIGSIRETVHNLERLLEKK